MVSELKELRKASATSAATPLVPAEPVTVPPPPHSAATVTGPPVESMPSAYGIHLQHMMAAYAAGFAAAAHGVHQTPPPPSALTSRLAPTSPFVPGPVPLTGVVPHAVGHGMPAGLQHPHQGPAAQGPPTQCVFCRCGVAHSVCAPSPQ